ncbi:hypothetical protein UFOVP178_56 [uncultured Caudovirales phage]|uniref:Uncharacterized protein n=1 Tax=uncultured Caudovirales phage TaxID=2100421 RepID=A0A6J7WCG1_9CAUD|nr:hypothetical protein UFOVP178_56 [uncultured Caudovirales phage]
MKTTDLARLETRVKPEVKKSLRVYCAHHGLTIREAVEMAVTKMCKPAKKEDADAS